MMSCVFGTMYICPWNYNQEVNYSIHFRLVTRRKHFDHLLLGIVNLSHGIWSLWPLLTSQFVFRVFALRKFLVSRQRCWKPLLTLSHLLFLDWWQTRQHHTCTHTFPHLSHFPTLPFHFGEPSPLRFLFHRNSHRGVPSELQSQSGKVCYPLWIFTYIRVCESIFCLF